MSGCLKRPRDDDSAGNTPKRREVDLVLSPELAVSCALAHDDDADAATLTLQCKLGEGEYGKVYMARWGFEQPWRAVKVLDMDPAATHFEYDCDMIAAVRELVLSAASGMPRSVLQFNDGRRYGLMMPLGATTLHWATSRRLPLAAVRELGRSLLNQLVHLHARGVMHRDIKPENVILRWETPADLEDPRWPELHIVDYGLSTAQAVSKDPQVVTLWWRAPEVLLKMAYSNKVDVWSVGIMVANWVDAMVVRGAIHNSEAIAMVWDRLGRPSKEDWPAMYRCQRFFNYCADASEAGTKGSGVVVSHPQLSALLNRMLQQNPDKRPTAAEALEDPFWTAPLSDDDEQDGKRWLRQCNEACNRGIATPRNAAPLHVYLRDQQVKVIREETQEPPARVSDAAVINDDHADALSTLAGVYQYTPQVLRTALVLAERAVRAAPVGACGRATVAGAVYVAAALLTDHVCDAREMTKVARAASVDAVKAGIQLAMRATSFDMPDADEVREELQRPSLAGVLQSLGA